MQHKHLWIVFLVLQIFSVFQAKGQEQQKNTISVPLSTEDKRDLHRQPAQPSLQFATSGLWNSDESFHEIANEIKASFNLNCELNYLNNFTRDASFLYLPVHPGVGDYQNYGGTLGHFNIANMLVLNYGALISVQYGYLFSSKQIVLGSNVLLRYAITNKLQFQAWGQYVTPGNSSDPTFKIRTFFPTTNFGTGLKYDSNQKTKIKVGIEYQYDQGDKTWKPESGGKVLLKF